MPQDNKVIELGPYRLLLSTYVNTKGITTIEIDSDAPTYNQALPIYLTEDQARQLIAVLTALLEKGGA